MKRLVFALGLCFLLAGCGNAVEISDRDMVVVMGIDKGDADGFKVTTGSAVLTGEGGGKGRVNIKSAEGESLPKALEENNRAEALSPFYGQLKTVVIGGDILKDRKMLESTVGVLLKNNDINMRTIVIGCRGEAEEVVKAVAEKENEYGLYIWESYKNTGRASGYTFEMTVNDIALNMGGAYLMPEVRVDGKDIDLSGAFVMDGFEFKGELSGDEMVGAMLIKEDIRGKVISFGRQAGKIKSNKRDIRFLYTDKKSVCCIDIFIKVQPLTDGFDIEGARDKAERDTKALLDKLYKDMGADALGIDKGFTDFEVNVIMAVE